MGISEIHSERQPVDDYNRGRVDAILEEHGLHLSRINGTIERFAKATEALTLAIQRLSDSAQADRETVKVTAEALEKQDQTRRDKSENNWSPALRWAGIFTALAAIGTFFYYVIGHP